ncbi:elongation factor G [Caldanaerobius fijiensis DSM 17918]|uniref:Elongation factor G n=1 Tax=Caldanaerobius fijiensis DSM 17918 TaxID=1121256 RepID=A0A1M5BWK5_9THEO|nr:elongation factor G [Caldanaerobius fijiensis]SHF46750.1 elongation factor G [Caldanaerobius fijiensis DSM 17918]
MKAYEYNAIRNVALISHSGAGKTTLAEAALYVSKAIDRMGRVEEGNTVSDFDPEEIARSISISASLIPVEWKTAKINLIDTPGYFDFVGEMLASLRAVEGAVLVVSSSGPEVGTEIAWKHLEESGLPGMFFINKMDKENADFSKTLQELKDLFGNKVVALQLPIGQEDDFKGYVDLLENKAFIYNKKGEFAQENIPDDMVDAVAEAREELIEDIAELDEGLLEKFFGDEQLSVEELKEVLKKGVAQRELFPVLCGSALKNIGVSTLMDAIVEYMPTPADRSADPFSAFVFKTIADPYVGKISLFKVLSGSVTPDSPVLNSTKEVEERIGQLFVLRGKKQIPVDRLLCGDIGGVAKLASTSTGDTLCDPKRSVVYDKISYPEPNLAMAIEPQSEGDEEKISNGLLRLNEEDPTFKVIKNNETGQFLLYGYGEVHLEVIVKKLMTKFGIGCQLTVPKVAYRETIKGHAKVEGKHKKQTGGHGQYGHVWIEFEPLHDKDFEFVDKIFGGAVPKQFIPAVEKGLRECMKEGILAGYPVVNIKATLVDGSYHPVDSSEMAFKVAASLAFKKGMQQADPVMLEPILHVEVTVPEEYMGDVIGDLNKRRGRILGMQPEGRLQVITAEVPEAEMFRYATDLRSLTHARGTFTMRFERYEEMPPQLAQKIIEETKLAKEA